MMGLNSLLALLGLLTACTNATALTYKMHPNEKECFYANVDKAGSKIAFYFAVQSGGDFDSKIMGRRETGIGHADSWLQSTTTYTDQERSPARRRSC